jgi:hypothetical protein
MTAERPPPSNFIELPKDIKMVTEQQWEAEMKSQRVVDPEKSANMSRDLDRLRDQLARKKLIGVRDGFVWLATNNLP